MFCKRSKPLVFLTISFILMTTGDGCARAGAAAVERLAVMPIENLSSDAQLDWSSHASAAVVVYDLAGARKIFAKRVGSLSGAQSMQASRLLEGYFFVRSGRIGIRATIEDLESKKAVESWEIDGPAAGGFLPLANQLARNLSSEARTFGTNQENAFRFFGEAMAAPDSKNAEQVLQQSTDADPGFAAAYVEQAKLLAETGDREGARRVAEAGEKARLDPIERADLKYAAASASGDAGDRMQALELLTAATPTNANIFRELGETRFARRQFQQAAMEYRVSASLDPAEPRNWNELGYALAWTKDLKGARAALAEYQKLAPGDVNALDSQGEVSYMLGDFQSAGAYFERAAAKNPQEWVKAAEARLMMGDLKGADALFAKFLRPGANAQLQMAQWEYLSGRRKSGMARMEKLAQGSSGDFQSVVLSQLSIWKLDVGETKAAADLAAQAATKAQSPQAQGISGMCADIASGSTGSGSKLADALALLFAGKLRETLPLLQAVYSETSPSPNGQVRALLAWTYVETDAVDKAAPLLDVYPLPLPSSDPLFVSLILRDFWFARGRILEQEGKRDEAKKSFERYMLFRGRDQFGTTN